METYISLCVNHKSAFEDLESFDLYSNFGLKWKGFADNNFRFNENCRKFSKWVENTVGKGEIARYEQFLFFPLFSKDLYCKHVNSRTCLENS